MQAPSLLATGIYRLPGMACVVGITAERNEKSIAKIALGRYAGYACRAGQAKSACG